MTITDLTRLTGEFPRAQLVPQGRHHRHRRIPRLPRRTAPAALLIVDLVEAAGAAGWILGYGWSPAGAMAAFAALLTLALRAGVSWV